MSGVHILNGQLLAGSEATRTCPLCVLLAAFEGMPCHLLSMLMQDSMIWPVYIQQ